LVRLAKKRKAAMWGSVGMAFTVLCPKRIEAIAFCRF
jgi:hypothetical protein